MFYIIEAGPHTVDPVYTHNVRKNYFSWGYSVCLQNPKNVYIIKMGWFFFFQIFIPKSIIVYLHIKTEKYTLSDYLYSYLNIYFSNHLFNFNSHYNKVFSAAKVINLKNIFI